MKLFKSGITGAVSLALATMLALPLTVMASGGDYGNDQGALTVSKYEKGKKIFKDKITCSNCPYADLELTQDNVASLLPELASDGSIGESLSKSDRRSVQHYIEKRFKL